MTFDLVTIGDLNIDWLVQVPRFPGEDDEVPILKMEHLAGGDAANVAAAASKLGKKTALIAALGGDEAGKALLAELGQKNVETSGVQIYAEERTGSVISIVRADGQRSLLCYRGANNLLRIGPKQADLMAQSRLVHISDPLPELIPQILEVVSQGRQRVSIDPGSITAARGLAPLAPLLNKAQIFLANESEYQMLSGKSELLEAAKTLLLMGPQIAVIKMGQKGCAVMTQDETTFVDGFQVNVVDATGAGDAFDAAFLTAILEDRSLLEAAKFANAVGALTTTRLGAQIAQPTRGQADILANRK